MANSCLQYIYPSSELAKKYNIKCSDKSFLNYDNLEYFNNEDFLRYISNNYSNNVFENDSPFTFDENYINKSNDELCNPVEFSLKPQQKFLGQIINPNTNIQSSLVFHGLGSGKTCTSLVVGEAFKNTKTKHLLYVVPAPLVNQYYEEIIGEIKQNKIMSCTSQCVIKDNDEYYKVLDNINELKIKLEKEPDNKDIQRDLFKLNKELNKYFPGDSSYSNINDQKILDHWNIKLKEQINVLNEIDELDNKKISKQQNEILTIKNEIKKVQSRIKSVIERTFEIISHDRFILRLFKISNDRWTKMEYLTDQNSPLLNPNNLLVIDEIQRLVSEKGILYQKLFTAIYQYFHNNLRILLLSATPIYDNPYELALTMNLLKPRIMFPLDKKTFYSMFLGEKDEQDNLIRVKGKNWIKDNSALINKELLNLMCSGYVSYFKGGNPNAYPYKRIIEIKYPMGNLQKDIYIKSLKADLEKDKQFSKIFSEDEFIFNESETAEDENIKGMYVKSQQFSNIGLEYSEKLDKSSNKVNITSDNFKLELERNKFTSSEEVLNYIRVKEYSNKFVNIIDLSLRSNGPVFIFSNWLQFGVKPLSYILQACGLTEYPKEDNGKGRYFIWSSETSQNTDLTSKAKQTFNSFENKDGSLLKIILGTRSVMEGVSFKNVKQVHITEPWWNEARIEQILARAVRFCSHSRLPLEEQYTDIYKHFSVLPESPDPEITEFLLEKFGRETYRDFESLSVEEKMLKSSQKKLKINLEFENVLKESSYDCELNKNGNIIRLEENVKSVNSLTGKYQIIYKNPITLQYFIREEIPEQITYLDIINRTYSYPNKFINKFYLAKINNTRYIKDPNEYILTNIDSNLNLLENINCWKSNKLFKDIDIETDIREYLLRISQNYSNSTIDILKKNILLKKQNLNVIRYDVNKQMIVGRPKLFKCLTKLSESSKISNKLKNKITKFLKNKEIYDQKIKIIEQLTDKFNIVDDSLIIELLSQNMSVLIDMLK